MFSGSLSFSRKSSAFNEHNSLYITQPLRPVEKRAALVKRLRVWNFLYPTGVRILAMEEKKFSLAVMR